MNRLVKRSVTGIILMGSLGWAVAHADLNFGVNALRGSADATATWSELGKFLSAEIGEPVNLLPLKVTDVVAEVKKEKIDLVLANPVQMVQLQMLANATPLVSLNTKNGVRFAGVIFARKDSGISKAHDLKGKKIAAMPKAAAGGYIFQAFHLFQKGVDIRKDFAAVRQVQSKMISS
jgi:phosphonate transport system substrate-binding protein